MKRVILVAAVARNGVIGRGPEIPWSIPGEQREFKELTLGHVLVMGRATYESIGRPLPGRTTIVLTRDRDWTPAPEHRDQVLVARGLLDALAKAAAHEGEVIIAGGARVYREAIRTASELIISEVPLEPEGDAFFPEIDPATWQVTDREHFDGYDRVWYARVE